MTNYLTRVYSNGSAKTITTNSKDFMDDWVKYNTVHRFGCALFLNGAGCFRGYLSEEKALLVQDWLQHSERFKTLAGEQMLPLVLI